MVTESTGRQGWHRPSTHCLFLPPFPSPNPIPRSRSSATRWGFLTSSWGSPSWQLEPACPTAWPASLWPDKVGPTWGGLGREARPPYLRVRGSLHGSYQGTASQLCRSAGHLSARLVRRLPGIRITGKQARRPTLEQGRDPFYILDILYTYIGIPYTLSYTRVSPRPLQGCIASIIKNSKKYSDG